MKRFISILFLLIPALYACTDISDDGSKEVTSVVLSKDKVDLRLGESVSISATVMPESLGMGVVWSVLDPQYADVKAGTITGKAYGVTYVVATSADGTKKAACMVSVNPEGKYSVYIKDEFGEPVTAIYGYPGMSEVLSASTTDGETHEFTWSIEDAAVGSITEDGILTLSASESTNPEFVYDAESFVKVATEDGFSRMVPLRSSMYKGIRCNDKYQAAGDVILVWKERSYPIAVLYEGASGPVAIPADDITLDLSNTTDFSIQKEADAYSLVTGDAANGVSTKLSVSTIGSTGKVEIAEFQIGDAVDAEIVINDFATFKAFLTSCQPGKTVKGKVMADITLSSSEIEEIDALYPVADFDGIIEGNNHTIAGLTKPLFGQFGGRASDLTLNSTLSISEAMENVGIFAQSASHATLTGCASKGSLTFSASGVTGDIAVGGLIGRISGCTLVACHNEAIITNNATASGTACIGGLVGVADGANTLSGSSTAYNYNQGIVIEESATTDVAVGGVCGYSTGAASNFNYCQSLALDGEDVDDIEIKNNTKNKVYVGGIIGKSAVTSSMDYTYNSSDIKFTNLKIVQTGQVFAGGIIGGWSASGEQTITGCENIGWVYTKASAGDLAVADSDYKPKYWSCFGGIAGMGAGTGENLGGGWDTITGKTFTNCTNSGTVRIYAALRCCIGGVVAYTENNPDGCVCTASDIRPYLTGGIGQVGSNYHRNICGGVVGLFTGSKVSNLKSTAKIVSQSSSPFAYTGGIIGYVPDGTIELENCKVSNHVQATGSGDGRSALMCHVAQNTVTVTFTNCVVKSGTISYSTGSKVTISNSNLTSQHCVGSGSKYTITGDVLPTVADSID